MKLKTLMLLTGIFISLFANAQNAPREGKVLFSELPQLIKEKNEKVQASELLVAASKKRTGFLVRSFLPEIALRTGNQSAKLGSASTEQRDYWSADAQLNIYRGSRDRIEEKIRDSKAQASGAEYVREYQTELREAKKTYWQIVANEKILAELQDALKTNKENIQSAKRRSGAGVTTNADAVQFELENTTLTQNLKKLILEQDLLKSRLAVAIGHPNHEAMLVESEFAHPPESIDPSLASGQKNPDTEVLRIEENLHFLKRDKASRWWVPSVDLYATYRRPTFLESDTRALARENELVAGIQVSMNLGAGFEDAAIKSAEDLEAQASSKRLSYTLQTAQATKHELSHDLKLLHELIHDADKDVERSTDFLKLTKNEYSRGVKNGPDLQEAFSKFYEFKNRRTELYRLYYQTLADLEYQAAGTSDKP